MKSIGAILLAAGSGSRMGQTKQLMKISGQSLVRRAAVAAIDAGCQPVIVVTGADAEAVAGEIRALSAEAAHNSDWPRGMGTSIRWGLAAALAKNPDLDAVVLLLCDQPHLTSKVIADLLATWTAHGKPIAACRYGETLGSPCCIGRSLFGELANLADDEGAKRLIVSNPADVAVVSWPQGIDDLDTPADWQRFRRKDN